MAGFGSANVREARVCIQMIDLAGFAGATRGAETGRVMAFLEDFFVDLGTAIGTHRGRLVEYLGDGGLWYADDFIAHKRLRFAEEDYTLDQWRAYLEPGYRDGLARASVEVIETRGELLVLTKSRFSVSGTEHSTLTAPFDELDWWMYMVTEVDERGRLCAVWTYDVEDLDKARATLEARSAVVRHHSG